MKEKLIKLIKKNNYTIIDDITQDIFGRFHGKLANKKGQVFFLKAISNQNGYSYQSLKAETKVTSYLSYITAKKEIVLSGYRLIIPKVESIIVDENIICQISDFIGGVKLLDLSSKEQKVTLKLVINLVNKLGEQSDLNSIKPYLHLYTKSYVLLKTPLKLAKAVLLNPNFTIQILKSALKVFGVVFQNTKHSLIHADINASNVIIDGKKIYLTDWEEAGLGITELNTISAISVHWKNKEIRNYLLKSISKKKKLMTALLAYRTLSMLNQKINFSDQRHIRDMELLAYVAGKEK